MASSDEMILILVIVMEGEDAIIVAAAGGGYCFGRLIERASSVRDINTYFMILGFGRVMVTCMYCTSRQYATTQIDGIECRLHS